MIDRREVIEPTEAERELKAATRRSEVNAAARPVMLAKAEVKRLELKPTRRASGVAAAATSS